MMNCGFSVVFFLLFFGLFFQKCLEKYFSIKNKFKKHCEQKSSQVPNGFQGRPCSRLGKALHRFLHCCNRQHHQPGNLFLTIWHHQWHEGSKEGWPAHSCSVLSWELLTRGAAVGAGGCTRGLAREAGEERLPGSSPMAKT